MTGILFDERNICYSRDLFGKKDLRDTPDDIDTDTVMKRTEVAIQVIYQVEPSLMDTMQAEKNHNTTCIGVLIRKNQYTILKISVKKIEGNQPTM